MVVTMQRTRPNRTSSGGFHGDVALDDHVDGAVVRSLVHEVRVWALAHGHIATSEALEVILSVKAARSDGGGTSLHTWVGWDAEEMVWADLVAWCRRVERTLPGCLAETLWTYLGFLTETGRLASGSDDLITLRRPLLAYGGLGADGRARPRPGRPRRRTAVAPPPPAPEPILEPEEESLAVIIPFRPRSVRSDPP